MSIKSAGSLGKGAGPVPGNAAQREPEAEGGRGEGGRLLQAASGCLGVLGSGRASSGRKSSAFRGRRQREASVDGEILLSPPQNDAERQVLGELKPRLGGFPSRAREGCCRS